MAAKVQVHIRPSDSGGLDPDALPSPTSVAGGLLVGEIPPVAANTHGTGPPKNIFEAAERGNVSFITRLVERSLEFDINQRDKIQRTALHWAAELNHIEVAEALLDYNIDPAATDCNGRTAIHLAAREGHADMLRVITEDMPEKQREMLVNQRDMFGLTPVYLSLQRGEESRPAFEFLMRAGAKYNCQLRQGTRTGDASASLSGEATLALDGPAAAKA